MCKLIDKELKKSFVTGYKIAVQKGSHYYSPATGVEYKKGKVKETKKYLKNALRYSNGTEYFSNGMFDPRSGIFNDLLVGRTAIFENFDSAKIKKNHWYDPYNSASLVILEMTLSKDLLGGNYDGCSVFAGSEIVSIRKVD